MRSEQFAGLVMGTPAGIRLACRRIADIVRAVAPHRVHDHCQLARHGHAGLAVAGALGDRLAPSLDLVGALEARHQPRCRLVKRASYISIAGFRYATLNVDRGARLVTPRGQPEVGRDDRHRGVIDPCVALARELLFRTLPVMVVGPHRMPTSLSAMGNKTARMTHTALRRWCAWGGFVPFMSNRGESAVSHDAGQSQASQAQAGGSGELRLRLAAVHGLKVGAVGRREFEGPVRELLDGVCGH